MISPKIDSRADKPPITRIRNENAFKRKLLAICPVCGRKIYGRDLNLHYMNLAEISDFPFSIVYCHTSACVEEESPDQKDESVDPTHQHAIALYLDADLRVRSIESCDVVLLERKN